MLVPKYLITSVLTVFIACIVGCVQLAPRPISDPGYPGDRKTSNPYYKGELSELDVLGVPKSQTVSESDIQNALAEKQTTRIPKGSSIIVIQSGAISPDEPLLDEMSKHFKAIPFSGVPTGEGESYSKRLRLSAANGGYTHILCYWGVLETAQEDKATKKISWVPIFGPHIPDETQRMRIRLRAALIDVGTGKWSMVTPEPIDDSAISAQVSRTKVDQDQVELLKRKGYSTLVSELSRYFTP
jgi:hypothetical protein